jgi:pentose-5-phosphate-3-epimerase/predicted transcriptional regulator
MKISASIYSDQSRAIEEVIKDLHEHGVDLFHVDCNDEPRIFEDIKKIRQLSHIPIDLHIISDKPEAYFDLLRENPVEFVTFQYENLKEHLLIPSDIGGFKGLAITTPTPVSVFDEYSYMDFLLVMATTPGKSGGSFDAQNFRKVRAFSQKYPTKRVHVDGGVNNEVSFILRNLGVYVSVSGSYLFQGPSVGNALMKLLKNNTQSSYKIEDFCRTRDEAPIVVFHQNLQLLNTLEIIEEKGFGFCMLEDKNQKFIGIISMADIRRGLIRTRGNCELLKITDIINRNPVTIRNDQTVREMLGLIRMQPFPITYLPVVDRENRTFGMISFVNLVKGEM